MIYRIIIIFFVFYVSSSTAGVDICDYQYNNYPDSEASCNQIKLMLDHLDSDFNVMRRGVETRFLEVDAKVEKSEVRSFQLKSLKEDINRIENELWDTFNIILVLVGVLAALGAVFIVRENHILKTHQELEAKQLKMKKRKIDSKINESLETMEKKVEIELERRVEEELEMFRKKLKLQEVLMTKVIDKDVIYDSIRHMDQKPRFDYMPVFLKLRKLVIDDDELVESIDKAIERAKSSAGSK